ncbi:hypothetical protein QBC45DRAFT_446254 [Copromyces sp. CBS 386.78]|nr:hypothetical protein QBC45DRAFT_446254 [Copromyces sp. CBS 386.78]
MYPAKPPSLEHKSSLEEPSSSSFRRSSSDDDSAATLLATPILSFALFLSITTIYTTLTIHHLSLSFPLATDYGDCGTSETVEEARAKGCVFDAMSWIWVRPECYDAELVEDFFMNTNYSWHTEPKLKPDTKVPMDVIRRGDHPKLFVQKEYHSVHCAYMMKKMHKAIIEHRPMDSYLTDWHHTNHCGMVMLNDIMHGDVECTPEMVCPTWVRATWTACRRF